MRFGVFNGTWATAAAALLTRTLVVGHRCQTDAQKGRGAAHSAAHNFSRIATQRRKMSAMKHDLTKTTSDRKPITMDMPDEVRSWCKLLGITEAQLRFAVGQVGQSARKVREYLDSPAR